ncbi:hypothetical protein PGTUg99_000201 [Puccinia graminis f. sp. tritici]|uniref:Uncharacterized protein n=1 Tax=Puccinia graminis f. sp. tritici TaxID=56615 RepID=A0A5B0RHW6_PUCGR|nr:hypothetical protein PGTUg99_000201 [Puccinia graminis f. sp. tritici]
MNQPTFDLPHHSFDPTFTYSLGVSNWFMIPYIPRLILLNRIPKHNQLIMIPQPIKIHLLNPSSTSPRQTAKLELLCFGRSTGRVPSSPPIIPKSPHF